MNSLRGTRPRREFYCNCSRGARILPKAFCFGCWIARFGHSPLAGVAGMLCRRTARLQVRCARGGGRGCGESGALARGGAASLRGCAVRLRPHRRLSLSPLNNNVFAPTQKLLMRLARIKRAYNVRTCAAHVRRHTRRRAMRGWSRIALERCYGCVTHLSFPLEQQRFCALAKTLDAP